MKKLMFYELMVLALSIASFNLIAHSYKNTNKPSLDGTDYKNQQSMYYNEDAYDKNYRNKGTQYDAKDRYNANKPMNYGMDKTYGSTGDRTATYYDGQQSTYKTNE